MTKPSVSIVIPVYDNIHRVRELILSIIENTDLKDVDRILVSDDVSGHDISARLKEIVREAGEPFFFRENKHNLGFGGNCNAAFDELFSEIVVIINSDVVVPPNWLPRILAAFSNDQVVLASPLSNRADAQSINYAPGTNWREVDDLLAQRRPYYPEAPKLSGFMLAIRKSRVPLEDGVLFDVSTYGKGYWEDTDLHYRVKSAGFRSIIVDNLYIKHLGFQSFALDHHRSIALSQINEKKFLDRWKVDKNTLAPQRVIGAFDMLRRRSNRQIMWRQKKALDVLFVLPLSKNSYSSGGGNAVFDIVDSLIDAGLNAAILVPNEVDTGFFYGRGFMPFTEVSDLYRLVKSIKQVYATSGPSLSLAKAVANRYGRPLYLFAQGPESFFGDGENASNILRSLEMVDGAVTVSSYMSDYCAGLGVPVVAQIEFGPSRYKFFELTSSRRPNLIAIHVSSHLNKGLSFAVTFGAMAQRLGFEVVYFGVGAKENLPSSSLGALPWTGLRQLFSEAEFVADFSIFEGLGLLSLEAAFCGCIPIFTRKGGIDSLFIDGDNAIILPDHTEMQSSLERIRSLTRSRLEEMAWNAKKLVDAACYEKAVDAFIKIVLATEMVAAEREMNGVVTFHRQLPPNGGVSTGWWRHLAHFDELRIAPFSILQHASMPAPGYFGYVDNASANLETICFEGWLLSRYNVPPSAILLSINNIAVASTPVDVIRSDVWEYIGISSKEACGFSLVVNVGHIIELIAEHWGFERAVNWSWDQANVVISALFGSKWVEVGSLPIMISDLMEVQDNRSFTLNRDELDLPTVGSKVEFSDILITRKYLEHFSVTFNEISAAGWLVSEEGRAPDAVAILVNKRIVGVTKPDQDRPDVWDYLGLTPSGRCGYHLAVDRETLNEDLIMQLELGVSKDWTEESSSIVLAGFFSGQWVIVDILFDDSGV